MSIPTNLNPIGVRPYKRKLRYLESTGTQWIDTGIVPDAALCCEVHYEWTTKTGDNRLFGTRSGYLENGFSFGPFVDGNVAIMDFGNARKTPRWSPYLGNHTFSYINGGVYIDETLQQSFDNPQFNSRVRIIYLLAFNDNSRIRGYSPATTRIYNFRLYKSDGDVLHLIPVLDNNNTPCMYDKVSKQFFYNQGTGQFLFG